MGEVLDDDWSLLRAYAGGGSGEAFAALVARHADLVHSAAMRQVHDSHLAEDVTQAVFILLAQKARKLVATPAASRPRLAGWLYNAARYASRNALKVQRRRAHHEREAAVPADAPSPHSSDASSASRHESWPQVAPLLDAAMARLSAADREAVLLRYFQSK